MKKQKPITPCITPPKQNNNENTGRKKKKKEETDPFTGDEKSYEVYSAEEMERKSEEEKAGKKKTAYNLSTLQEQNN